MKTRNLVYIAVSTALLAVSSWLAFPIGAIPVTLQTLVVYLAAGLLGWQCGLFAVLAYLLLGFVGVPVFSGFAGGAFVLLSPTGGYLIGFLFIPLIMGAFLPWAKRETDGKKILPYALGAALGVLCCYAFGTLWCVLGIGGEAAGLVAALSTCVLPYLPFDIVKIAAAVLLIIKLEKYIKME